MEDEGAAPRRDGLVCCGLALMAAAAVGGMAPFLGRAGLAFMFYDDAFYYFQVARHVVRGDGFTFDGLHATNGFHPLWMFVLLPVFRFARGDLLPLRAVIVLESALVGLAVAVVYRTLRPRLGAAAAVAGALLLVVQPKAMHILRGGLESALLICLLTLAWSRVLALGEDAPRRRWLELGLLCALLFLCRLESLVALAVIVVMFRRALAAQPVRGLLLAGPACVCALAYVAWNRLAFGTWGPVSGLVKWKMAGIVWARLSPGERVASLFYLPWSGESALRALLGRLGLRGWLGAPLATVLLLAAVLLALAPRSPLRAPLRRSGVGFVLATALTMVALDKVTVRLMFDWYRSPAVLATALAAAVVLSIHASLARIAAAVAVAVALAQVPLAWWKAAHPATARPTGLQAADWLRPRIGLSRPAGSWNSGLIGYFAGDGLVNLDGLANDAAFAREVVYGRRLPDYLEREGVLWLVDVTHHDGRLAPLQNFSPEVVERVRARYRPAVTFDAACVGNAPGCGTVEVWAAPAAQYGSSAIPPAAWPAGP